MHRISVAAGDVLYRKGDTAEYAYLLLSGNIAMEREGTALAAEVGTVIGLSALLQLPYGATARASDPVDVLAFTRRELRGLIRSDPDRALKIIDGMINLIVKINRLEGNTGD